MLEYKGYEQFVPWRKTALTNVRRRIGNEQALFPGYVFCRLITGSSGSIITTPGVIRIVGRRGMPVPLNPEEVKNIQLIIHSELPPESHRLLKAGSTVVIEDGPLRGLTGCLVRIKNKQRVAVSVNLLCRSVTVEMGTWQIRPVGAQSSGVSKPDLPSQPYLYEEDHLASRQAMIPGRTSHNLPPMQALEHSS